MQKTIVGTVSTRGWARTPEEMIREAINHFTEAGYSQTVLYRGKIKSLSMLRAMHVQSPEDLADAVRDNLTALLGNIFSADGGKVEVDVTTESDGQSEVVYMLVIAARVTLNNQQYDVANNVRLIGETRE